ncbi:MAG: amidohydrolase family protein, partial [Caulobacterales bacterium]
KDAGAFLFTNGNRPIADARVMRRIMTYAKGFDLCVMHRAEDPHLGQGVMNESDLSARLGLSGIPAEAETIMLQRDLALSALTGVRYVMDMTSSGRSVELLRQARASGQKIGATVSINHLLLNENDVGDYRTFAKLSPPLRGEDDRQALVRAVAEGVIEYVVSGHVPQPAEDKRLPFSEAAFGSSGLEALLPGLLTLVQTEDLTIMQALRAVTSAPAGLLGLWQGRLAVGAPADLVLIDPARPFVFDADAMLSRSKNSALDGRRLQGRAEITMVSGKIVHRAAA